jgi:hypothetical protein
MEGQEAKQLVKLCSVLREGSGDKYEYFGARTLDHSIC